MKPSMVKMIGMVILVVVLLNLILFAFVITNWIVFWAILAAAFFFVKWVLPRMRK